MYKKVVRSLLLFSGIISLVLGVIGIFLPLLPTTPFILLSTYCFARSSERFHRYLIHHKVFGKIVSDYYGKRIISTKTKIIAIAMMWTSLLLSITFFMPFIWVKMVVVAIGVSVTIYLVSYKSK